MTNDALRSVVVLGVQCCLWSRLVVMRLVSICTSISGGSFRRNNFTASFSAIFDFTCKFDRFKMLGVYTRLH